MKRQHDDEDRGPRHVEAEVLSSRRIGAYTHLTVRADGVPERFRPGTFVALDSGGDRTARRALWIHQIRTTGGYGPTLELVVHPRGAGTSRLAGSTVGDRWWLTGPLGRAFALPKEPVTCLLVGQGVSAAPLLPLADRLRDRGCSVTLLLGAADEQQLLSAREARRSARAVHVATADGSVGQHAPVASVVGEHVLRAGADVVYGAGPDEVLYAVAAAAETHGAWSQVAVEGQVSCGTGLCYGCVVPVVAEHGVGRPVRACAEGPVFRGDRVQWHAMGVAR